MIRKLVWLMYFALFSFSVVSGTIVDIRDKTDRHSQFLSDGKMARLNPPNRKTYVIIDHAKQSLKLVKPNRREVIDLSGAIPSFGIGGSGPDKTALTIEAEGDGPEVAGYQTQQYKLSLNGEFCGTLFASRQALEDIGMYKTFRTLQKVTDKLTAYMTILELAMSPCLRGMLNTLDQVENIGNPLRSLDQKGEMDFEITQIQLDAGLPRDTFVIPDNYKVLTAAHTMQQFELKIRTGIQNSLKNPAIQKMLESLKKPQN